MSSIFLSLVLLSVILFFFLSSPFPMSLMLMLISFWIGALSWLETSKWMSIAMILIFVGGMMVVFLYVSSLALNLKFYSKKMNLPLLLFLSILMSLMCQCTLSREILAPASSYLSLSTSLSLFLVSYLMVIMFFVSKISESLKGALVKKL